MMSDETPERPLDKRVPGYLGRVLGPDGAAGTCFQVAREVLVTAWHVLAEIGAAAEGAALRIDPLAGGEVRDAQVLRLDPVHDLAVITTYSPLPTVAGQLAVTDLVALRESVRATGHSYVADRHVYRSLDVTGEWAGGTVRNDHVALGCMTAGRVMPGMSGAPVIRDADGKVVGVISGRYNSADEWLRNNVWVARTEDLLPLLAGIADVALTTNAAALDLDDLGVRPSREDIYTGGDPFYRYVERDVDSKLDAALDKRVAAADPRMLVLHGDAMAGKSRGLAEAVRRHRDLRTWTLIRPPTQVPLEHAIDVAGKAKVLLWLDDLDRYLPAIRSDQLRGLLMNQGIAVLATIRTDQLTILSEHGPRSGWEIINDGTLTQRITLPSELTEREQFPKDQWPLRDREQVFREALGHGKPLGEAIAAGHEMLRKLAAASDDHRALADLLADWPSTGIAIPLPDSEAMRLWSSYLSPAKASGLASLSTEDQRREYEKVRDWLCTPVQGSRTAIAQRKDDGLVIDGLFRQQRSRSHKPPHREVFGCALAMAASAKDSDPIMLTIANRAVAAGYTSVAGYAPEPLADGLDARKPWQVLYRMVQRPASITIQAPDRVRAGSAITPLIVGRMIKPAEVEGARAYAECIVEWKYMGVTITNIEIGNKELVVPTPEEKTATTRLRVGMHNFLAPGTLPAYYAFSEMMSIHIPDNAPGRVQTSNVKVTWDVAAEILTKGGKAKGRKAKRVVPIEVAPRMAGKAPEALIISGGDAVALEFSGLPQKPVCPTDRITGSLLLHAKQDFLASAVSIKLLLVSSVHRAMGFDETIQYPVSQRDEPFQLRAGQSAELPFSYPVPADIPAPSIKSYDPGDAAEDSIGVRLADRFTDSVRRFRNKAPAAKGIFSTQWYLVGRVNQQQGPSSMIRQNIILVRERRDCP
jgi:Trypsin-like peptidase domain